MPDESLDEFLDNIEQQPAPDGDPRYAQRAVRTSQAPSSAIVVTTPFVGPKSIKRTIGPVTATFCQAAGPLGDLKASFRDAVGGRSQAIERVVSSIQSALLQQLSARAAGLGANAVIGTQMSVVEFGTNVFLGTGIGTAIVLAD